MIVDQISATTPISSGSPRVGGLKLNGSRVQRSAFRVRGGLVLGPFVGDASRSAKPDNPTHASCRVWETGATLCLAWQRTRGLDLIHTPDRWPSLPLGTLARCTTPIWRSDHQTTRYGKAVIEDRGSRIRVARTVARQPGDCIVRPAARAWSTCAVRVPPYGSSSTRRATAGQPYYTTDP